LEKIGGSGGEQILIANVKSKGVYLKII